MKTKDCLVGGLMIIGYLGMSAFLYILSAILMALSRLCYLLERVTECVAELLMHIWKYVLKYSRIIGKNARDKSKKLLEKAENLVTEHRVQSATMFSKEKERLQMHIEGFKEAANSAFRFRREIINVFR